MTRQKPPQNTTSFAKESPAGIGLYNILFEVLRNQRQRGASFYSTEHGVALATTPGNTKSINQDRALFIAYRNRYTNLTCRLMCIADGISSLPQSEEAAAMCIAYFTSLVIDSKSTKFVELLAETCQRTNTFVNQQLKEAGGSTFVALLIVHDELYVVSVGDSRAYLFSNSLNALTVDDNLASHIPNSSEVAPRMKFALLQYIGGDEIHPNVRHEKLTKDQRFILLSTDGTAAIPEKTHNLILKFSPNIRESASRLMNVSNWVGGFDNSTVLIFSLESEVDLQMDISNIYAASPFGPVSIRAFDLPEMMPKEPLKVALEVVQKPRRKRKRTSKETVSPLLSIDDDVESEGHIE